MDCPRLRDVSAYWDDEVTPVVAVDVLRHAANCADCADMLRFLSVLDDLQARWRASRSGAVRPPPS